MEEYWNRSERNLMQDLTGGHLSQNRGRERIVNTGMRFSVRRNSHRMLFNDAFHRAVCTFMIISR